MLARERQVPVQRGLAHGRTPFLILRNVALHQGHPDRHACLGRPCHASQTAAGDEHHGDYADREGARASLGGQGENDERREKDRQPAHAIDADNRQISRQG